jgi:hypothetical protein
MTATIVRLVLAMLMLPATGAVFLLSFIALVRSGPPSVATILGVWTIVYTFVAIYWLALWWPMVRWTGHRFASTVAVTALSLVIGAVVAGLCFALAPRLPVQLMMLVGGGTVPIAWVLGTVLIWRETPAERAQRLAAFGSTIVCPLCGYNMAGLRTATCPECGGAFTLDQLAAAQPRTATALAGVQA